MIDNSQAFFQQVLAEVMARSPQLTSVLLTNDKETSEKYMIDLLADRISTLIEPKSDEEIEAGKEDYERTLSHDMMEDYERLVERNRMLSSALGACDCWGEQENCSVCGGTGRPGWTLPERKAFAYFVRPVLSIVAKPKVPTTIGMDEPKN